MSQKPLLAKPRSSSRTVLNEAIILIEDRRFRTHRGIDPIAVVRSFVANLRTGRFAQGGSTITQQLARTLYLTTEKSLWRKIKECAVALYLERRWTKDEILRMYSANVYMGHRPNGTEIRGFNEASKFYFKKLLRSATIAEMAWLVAMLKGPNVYRPKTEKGRVRQTWVLSLMADRGLITVDELNAALGEL